MGKVACFYNFHNYNHMENGVLPFSFFSTYFIMYLKGSQQPRRHRHFGAHSREKGGDSGDKIAADGAVPCRSVDGDELRVEYLKKSDDLTVGLVDGVLLVHDRDAVKRRLVVEGGEPLAGLEWMGRGHRWCL